MIFLKLFLFVFLSYSCLATDNTTEEIKKQYLCTYSRTIESSGELKDLLKLDKFYHNYFGVCYEQSGKIQEEKTTSFGFHATKSNLLTTKQSGFQNEKNTTNSAILSKVQDEDGKIYEHLMQQTSNFDNQEYNLFTNNCGSRLGQLISSSNLSKDNKIQLLDYIFCTNNKGIGKEKIPECSNHIQDYYKEYEDKYSGMFN